MSLLASHEDLINRALKGLFLSFRPKLTREAVQLLGIRTELGAEALDYLPIDQRFSPDVALIKEGSTEIEVVIETKLSGKAQAPSLSTVTKFSKREGEDAAAVHAAVADPGYAVEVAKANADGDKPAGVWQIDAYFGWKWWEDEFPQCTLAPDVKFIYLSLTGEPAAKKYKGAPSAGHWDSANLVDLVKSLNLELRREQEQGFVPDEAGVFTQDEKDAIAVLTFLVYTHLGGEQVSPHAWVNDLLSADSSDEVAA